MNNIRHETWWMNDDCGYDNKIDMTKIWKKEKEGISPEE